MAWRLLSMMILAYAASSWIETPAVITSLKLEGGETQKVLADYRYVYAGKQYTCSRVGLDNGSDNVGDYHRDLYRQLKKQRDANQPTTCFVNPDDPGQALLDRKLRPELVVFHIPFILAFGVVGLGIIIGSIIFQRNQKRRAAKLEEFSTEPWKVRDDWAAGEIISMRWNSFAFIGMFAFVWNSISFPISILFLLQGDAPFWVYILIILFPLIGIGLIWIAVAEALRLFRFGKSTFRMATIPGVVGGELTGVVMVPESVRPSKPYRVKLACIEQQTRMRGGESERTSVAIWEDSRYIDQTLSDDSNAQGVPIQFIIPSGEKPTDPDAEEPVQWKLTIEAEVPGPDFKAQFEVPVFVTADSKEGIVASHETISEFEVKETLPAQLARENLVARQANENELSITCPVMRNLSIAIVFLGVGAAFSAIGIGFLITDEGLGRYIFATVFTLCGFAMLVAGIGMLLSCSELTIENDRWFLKSGWYGFRGKGEEFSSDQIKRIILKEGMSSSGGDESKKWNHVIAKLTDGRSVKLVRSISDRRIERALLAELKRLAALSESDTNNE